MKPNVKNREKCPLSLSVLSKMYILIFYGGFLLWNSAFTFYGCTIWYWTQVQSYSVHCCSAFITLHSRSVAPVTSSTANIAWRKLEAQVQQSGGIPSILHQQLYIFEVVFTAYQSVAKWGDSTENLQQQCFLCWFLSRSVYFNTCWEAFTILTVT